MTAPSGAVRSAIHADAAAHDGVGEGGGEQRAVGGRLGAIARLAAAAERLGRHAAVARADVAGGDAGDGASCALLVLVLLSVLVEGLVSLVVLAVVLPILVLHVVCMK